MGQGERFSQRGNGNPLVGLSLSATLARRDQRCFGVNQLCRKGEPLFKSATSQFRAFLRLLACFLGDRQAFVGGLEIEPRLFRFKIEREAQLALLFARGSLKFNEGL